MSRLITISSDLASAFAGSEPAAQVAVLHFACAHAVNENGLTGSDVDQALEAVQAAKLDPVLSKKLNDLSETYDDRYFALTDEGGESPLLPGALENFLRARAASALAFSLDTAQSPSEALYEAISASPDRDSLIAALRRML